MKVEVVGESEAVVGDILTCKLKVEYINLKKGEQSGYVHSKSYPYLRRDTWYLIITDLNYSGMAAVEKLNVEDHVFEKEYKERLTRPGPVDFIVILCNDCYKGLDVRQQLSVNVVMESQSRVEYKYKKQDLRAVQDKSIFFKKDIEEYETDEDVVDDDQEKQKKKLDNDYLELKKKLRVLGFEKDVAQLRSMKAAFKESKKHIHGLPPP